MFGKANTKEPSAMSEHVPSNCTTTISEHYERRWNTLHLLLWSSQHLVVYGMWCKDFLQKISNPTSQQMGQSSQLHIVLAEMQAYFLPPTISNQMYQGSLLTSGLCHQEFPSSPPISSDYFIFQFYELTCKLYV